MRYQAIIQVVLIVISLALIFLVLQPKFSDIRATEEEAASYNAAISQIDKYNAMLQSLLDQANSFSDEDINTLYTYMPEDIDKLRVASDIKIIVERNNGILQGISAGELLETVADADAFGGNDVVFVDGDNIDPVTNYSSQYSASGSGGKMLVSQDFEVDIIASYQDMKEVMRDFERNAYPLRLVAFSYSADNSSDLQTFKLVLQTYAYGAGFAIDNN